MKDASSIPIRAESETGGAREQCLRAASPPLSPPPARPLLRLCLAACGGLSLALSVLGIFLPLLPTTPFVLLAAACFMRSSPRLHAWLCGHRWLGPYLRRYAAGEGIPQRARTTGLGLVWGSSLISAVTFWSSGRNELLWIPALAVLFGSYFLLRLKTWPAGSSMDEKQGAVRAK